MKISKELRKEIIKNLAEMLDELNDYESLMGNGRSIKFEGGIYTLNFKCEKEPK